MRKPFTIYELVTLAVLTAVALGGFVAASYAMSYLFGWGC